MIKVIWPEFILTEEMVDVLRYVHGGSRTGGVAIEAVSFEFSFDAVRYIHAHPHDFVYVPAEFASDLRGLSSIRYGTIQRNGIGEIVGLCECNGDVQPRKLWTRIQFGLPVENRWVRLVYWARRPCLSLQHPEVESL